MAMYRAVARELNSSDEEDINEMRDPRREEVGIRNVQEAAAVISIPRSGTREVIFLTSEERRRMFAAQRPQGARMQRGEVPRGQQRERIVRELRTVRVRFMHTMSSDDVMRTFRDAFSQYEIVGGTRVNRPTNHIIRRLLIQPNIR